MYFKNSRKPNLDRRRGLSNRSDQRFLKKILAFVISVESAAIFTAVLFFSLSAFNVIPTGVFMSNLGIPDTCSGIHQTDAENSNIFAQLFCSEKVSPPNPSPLMIATAGDRNTPQPIVNTPFPSSTSEELPAPVITITPIQQYAIANLEYAAEDLCSPIEGIEIYELEAILSQPFNVPNQNSDIGHHGADFGSYNFRGRYLYDVPVKAILSGHIAGYVVNRPPLGNAIIIETRYSELPESVLQLLDILPSQSLYHLYGHLLNEPSIPLGAEIECGQVINRLGKSQTVEAHLHLETRIGDSGLTIDSMAFYDTSATESELEEYLWWRTSGDFTPVDPMSIFLNFSFP